MGVVDSADDDDEELQMALAMSMSLQLPAVEQVTAFYCCKCNVVERERG